MKERILLADGQLSVRELLAGLLAREGRYEVIGHSGSGAEALGICRKLKPHLVILDLVLPELCGVEFLRRAAMLEPRPRLLVYCSTLDPQIIIEALRRGPDGFVMKCDPLQCLREAIGVVLRGGAYFTARASEHLVRMKADGGRDCDLSKRQREILQLIAEGRSSKEISLRLSLSTKTVENHRAQLMRKLRLHGVADLTRRAVKLGLVPAE